MRRTNKVRVKLNNAGMTLVEIIVAIAVLSIAIIPLMYAFVNSMRHNARARELQQTTVLAHTVIESCKSDTMQEVLDKLDYGTLVDGMSGVSYPNTWDTNGDSKITPDEFPANHTFYYEDIPLENQLYDMTLEFKNHVIYDSATGDPMDYKIMNSTSMNPYMDAMLTVHTNIDPADSSSMTPAQMDAAAYTKALEEIAAGIKTLSINQVDLNALGMEIDLSTSFIEDSFKTGGTHAGLFMLTRNITININSDASGVETVTVEYKYGYNVAGGYKYVCPDIPLATDPTQKHDVELTFTPADTEIETYTYNIYSNSNTMSKGAFLENIYLMYYPAYGTTNSMFKYGQLPDPLDPLKASLTDYIVVNNNLPSTREVNLYLVKQKNSDYTDPSKVSIMEDDYATKVAVVGVSPNSATTNLYHNFDYDISDGSAVIWNPVGRCTGVVHKGSMITENSKNMMYDIVVRIYKDGSVDATNGSLKSNPKLILSMDATDLSW